MNDLLSFSDIFKKNFIQNGGSSLTFLDIGITLVLSFLIGLFIFYIYKKTFQGVLYTKSFNISLIMIALVTSLVIMVITSNIVLSLGMVGALSIVRFRTAVKDSMDIVFIFWSITIGIINGAGFYSLSIIGSLFIGIILIILTKLKNFDNPYLLIVKHDNSYVESELIQKLKEKVKKYNIKSKISTRDNVEITFEFRLKGDDTSFINEISKIKGISNAVLVSYNGDYVS